MHLETQRSADVWRPAAAIKAHHVVYLFPAAVPHPIRTELCVALILVVYLSRHTLHHKEDARSFNAVFLPVFSPPAVPLDSTP